MSWYAKQNGNWSQVGDAKIRTSTAWNPVEEGWIKDNNNWVRFFKRDLTAPNPPILDVVERTAGFKISVSSGVNSNATRLTITSNTIGTLNTNEIVIITELDLDMDYAAGSLYEYLWETPIYPGLTYKFYATFYSDTGISSTKAIAIVDIPPETIFYQGYFDPTSGDSWVEGDSLEKGWNTSGDLIVQGGNPLHRGCWFYGNALNPLFGKTVTNMRIQVSRLNTEHGVAGLANVRLAHHDNKVKPYFSPNMLDPTKIGELRRGEKKWFDVPTDWYRGYKNNNANYSGFGLYTSDVGNNTDNHIKTNDVSANTGNGRLYVEWHT